MTAVLVIAVVFGLAACAFVALYDQAERRRRRSNQIPKAFTTNPSKEHR